MTIKIALAGNPNCGKTTLFNALTGSNQFVGNWPGVTVEKKEGRLKGHKDVTIMDLPGIYSLSPYTLEEVVARNYLIQERPDAIINIIDGTNLERNLYLTTQILELGIPVVVAINMMDILEKTGARVNQKELGERLGCEVVRISALKGKGLQEAAEKAVEAAKSKVCCITRTEFSENVEHSIQRVTDMLGAEVKEEQRRFFAIKLLEKDDKIVSWMTSVPDVTREIDELEKEMEDDVESIITNERYLFITSIIGLCYQKGKEGREKLSLSDRIDKVVTNRFLALPIFAVVMFVVYFVSVTTVGTWATDWANDGLFGDGFHLFTIGASSYEAAVDEYTTAVEQNENVKLEEPDPADYGLWVPGIPVLAERGLSAINCTEWLKGLILDGIIAGVGAVLGFVPQMLVLFIFLAFLESCGYMARVAFIMDRVFRRFGLSGKSFIPMLIGTGCGVPGIMAARTIESDRDRKMTIMTTTFIPCSAKLPIIGLIAGALFGGAAWVAPSAYFIGVAAIIFSGIVLKRTKLFRGDPAPFVMELPAYHWPTPSNILRSMWERGWSFIKKAGTIILLSTVVLWFLMKFGWVDGTFGMLEDEQLNESILASIGKVIAPIFAPLGWGSWKMAVAAVTGLIAKENVVGTFGILYGFAEVAEEGNEVWGALAGSLTAVAAYSFLVFNLLCAPCFAAMGAIRREMNNRKWFWFAIGYQTALAYVVSMCIYQIGTAITTGISAGTVVVGVILLIIIIAILRSMMRDKANGKSLQCGCGCKNCSGCH